MTLGIKDEHEYNSINVNSYIYNMIYSNIYIYVNIQLYSPAKDYFGRQEAI